jgi:Fur family ferric uptake transcriptional regulator
LWPNGDLDLFQISGKTVGVAVPVDVESVLRKAGLRVTHTRVAVLGAMQVNPHANTDSIIKAARTVLPKLSYQAVYDTLLRLVAVSPTITAS